MWWKSAAISKLELFLTEWSRSYIVLALAVKRKNAYFCGIFNLINRFKKEVFCQMWPIKRWATWGCLKSGEARSLLHKVKETWDSRYLKMNWNSGHWNYFCYNEAHLFIVCRNMPKYAKISSFQKVCTVRARKDRNLE